MAILVGDVFGVRVLLKLNEILAVINRFQQCALLDEHKERLRFSRMNNDLLYMMDMRRGREGPFLGLSNPVNGGHHLPAFTEIVAAIKCGRRGPGKQGDLVPDIARGQRVYMRPVDAVGQLAPVLSFSVIAYP